MVIGFLHPDVQCGALVATMLLLLQQFGVVQGQMTKLEATPCTNWEETKANLDSAKALWSQPACYDFSYTFLGFQVGLPAPKTVQVRNGVVAGGVGDKTIDDFFSMIETLCVADCPTKGAQRCRVLYDATAGYPSSILIDISQYIADEERMYSISDFAIVDCNAVPQSMLFLEGDEIPVATPASVATPSHSPTNKFAVPSLAPSTKEQSSNNNEMLSEAER